MPNEGFTRFFHDVEDALFRLKLNGTQWAIYIAIRSKTIGDGKPEGIEMTLQALSDLTGYHRTNIQPELAYLIEAGPVKKVRGEPRKPLVLTVNDDIDTWRGDLLAKRQTVVSQEANSAVSQKANNLLAKRQTSLKKERKEKKKKETRSSSADVRFQPFVDFAYEEYTRVFDSKLDYNKIDGKQLKDMLKRRPELTLTDLQERFVRLLASRDPWDKQQALGHPVRFLANNVNARG